MSATPAASPKARSSPDATAIVRIAVPGGGAGMSKAQKEFNRLTAQIAEQRRLLASWQDFIPQYRQRFTEELLPLQKRIQELELTLLRLFDAAHDGPDLTKRECAKLSVLICARAQDLLTQFDDDEVVALHDKHSDVGHEASQKEENDFLEAIAKDLVGETDETDAAADEAQEPPQHVHSAKAKARQARAQAEAQSATQSVREVFRKLASALHPDRETDPAERERKTALMQRVNQAYGNNDLLQLLELQIEVEMIDPTRLGDISESRLKHYVRVLKEQSQELMQELGAVIAPFAMGMAFGTGKSLTQATVIATMQSDAAAMRREAAELGRELAAFRDTRMLKAWLKGLRV